MALHKLIRRNYGRKSLVSIKYQNLHSFKEGVILLCQSTLETRRISHLHVWALFTIPLTRISMGSYCQMISKVGDLAKRQRGDKGHIVGVYRKGGSNLLHTMNRLHRKISKFLWFNIMSYHWCRLQCNLLNSWDILYFFIFLFLSSLHFAPAVWQSLFSTSAALTKLQDCCKSDSNLCPLSEHHLKSASNRHFWSISKTKPKVTIIWKWNAKLQKPSHRYEKNSLINKNWIKHSLSCSTVTHKGNLKITYMWRRWGTPQNLFLAFIDELEKQVIIKKNCWSGPIKNK